MSPLVTQVAIKIGAIDTEKSLRDRALPVFTGIISLHLANVVNGRECNVIDEWAMQITNHDLKVLFRKGYTLIDELVKKIIEGKKAGHVLATQSFAERIQHYSTHTENGVWAGYGYYQKQLTSYLDAKALHEFALWLFEKAGTPVTKIHRDIDIQTPETMVSRVLFNVLHSGKITPILDLRKVRRIADTASNNQKWFDRSQNHYSSFLESLPERFRQYLVRDDSDIRIIIVAALNVAKRLVNESTERDRNIDHICLMSGLNPPGFMKEEQKNFPM